MAHRFIDPERAAEYPAVWHVALTKDMEVARPPITTARVQRGHNMPPCGRIFISTQTIFRGAINQVSPKMGKLVRQKSFYGVIPDENAVAKKTEVPSWSKDRVNASRRSQASTGQSHGKESKTKRSWSRGAYESVDLLVASDSPNGDWAGHTRAPNGRKRVPAIKGNNSIEFPSLRENNERNAPSTAKVIAMDSRTGINIGGECRDLGPVMKHLAAYLKLDRTHWELWDADEKSVLTHGAWIFRRYLTSPAFL